MIEMRWYVPVNGEKVLQYRQKVDMTIYAGLGPFPTVPKTCNGRHGKLCPSSPNVIPVILKE